LKIIPKEIIELLKIKAVEYNNPAFIRNDPIQVPHQFVKKEDIEISGFLSSIIAWGNRTSIVNNAKRLMNRMGNEPYGFIMNSTEKEIFKLNDFVHRTFNGEDLAGFIISLKAIYSENCGLEHVFTQGYLQENSIESALVHFRKIFMENIEMKRTRKHISDVSKGSAAKRLNMYLRWMVRKDKNGVDFGIWKNIPPSALMIPLDVHVGNVARKLGLLERKQNDWKAVVELTERLRTIEKDDPVKYDFALFGMGMDKYFHGQSLAKSVKNRIDRFH
jgi:uncharacterized protein (TIGR02757 family)